MVCLRYIIVNTLHKGVNKDDDDDDDDDDDIIIIIIIIIIIRVKRYSCTSLDRPVGLQEVD